MIIGHAGNIIKGDSPSAGHERLRAACVLTRGLFARWSDIRKQSGAHVQVREAPGDKDQSLVHITGSQAAVDHANKLVRRAAGLEVRLI